MPVADGETVRTEDVEAVGLTTKPPARYNEATLLSAMEGAGKLVDDEELREAMSERGLGTPARARPSSKACSTKATCAAKAATWCPPPRRAS